MLEKIILRMVRTKDRLISVIPLRFKSITMLSQRIGNLFTKLFVLSLGLIFLLPSAYKLYTYGLFRYQSISVYGMVTKPSIGINLGARPFVEYKDSQGNAYEIKSKAKTHWFFAPRIGEKIKVHYKKNDPQLAIVGSMFHYIILPLFFIVVGVSFLYFVFENSRNRKNNSNFNNQA